MKENLLGADQDFEYWGNGDMKRRIGEGAHGAPGMGKRKKETHIASAVCGSMGSLGWGEGHTFSTMGRKGNEGHGEKGMGGTWSH